jgi:hypothetical protein
MAKSDLQKERGTLFTQIYNSVKNHPDAKMRDWKINCVVFIPEMDMEEDCPFEVLSAGEFGITEYIPSYASENGIFNLRARRAILYNGCLYTRYGVENSSEDYLLLKAAYENQSAETVS